MPSGFSPSTTSSCCLDISNRALRDAANEDEARLETVMVKAVLGIIGGSGLYDLPGLENKREVAVNSPWGEPSSPIHMGEIAGDLQFRQDLAHILFHLLTVEAAGTQDLDADRASRRLFRLLSGEVPESSICSLLLF